MDKMKVSSKMRRVLFLDIDGVLQPVCNQTRFKYDMDALKVKLSKRFRNPRYLELDKYDLAAVYYDWDKNAVKELKILLRESGAEIVLSSDWRCSKNLEQMRLLFKIHGLARYLKELVPRTKEFSDKPDDIPEYLEKHPELQYYCVLDDRFMGNVFPGHFVYVGNQKRALDEDLRKACVNILKNGPWWDTAEMETKLADRWFYKKAEERKIPEIYDGIRRAVFLDFDGVVNDDLGSYGDGITVREEAIALLSRLIYETDASLVFSSSRRMGYVLYLMGKAEEGSISYEAMKSFDELIARRHLMIAGSTPVIGSGPCARPAEIRTWLACRPEVESFVILDDDDFWVWDDLKDHFVRTVTPISGDPDKDGRYHHEPKRGITIAHVKRAIEILKTQKRPVLKQPFVSYAES